MEIVSGLGFREHRRMAPFLMLGFREASADFGGLPEPRTGRLARFGYREQTHHLAPNGCADRILLLLKQFFELPDVLPLGIGSSVHLMSHHRVVIRNGDPIGFCSH
jgi:hypothetical protein